jgi:glutathione S-transferase
MLKILGRLTSINVQKVVWCADELGLAYERVDVGGKFGGNDTPEYLAKNPNGYIPVIEEDGFVLYESNPIVRYLAARAADSGLWPEDLRERADMDRWMEWQSNTFSPGQRDAFWQLVRTPPEKRGAAAIEASRVKSEKCAAILDRHLAGRRYLAGDGFTAADIVVGCSVHRWLNLPLERTARPNLERYYAALKARPASLQVTGQPVS